MDALIAIAMLCQVSSGCQSPKLADAYQLKCQKELIACYEKASTSDWVGALKDCVKQREIK